MAGTPLKDLAVLKGLCGDENMKNIVLVTTMWDESQDESIGSKREEELLSTFWKDMVCLGSRTCRFQGTRESAWEIIDCLDLEGCHQTRAPLRTRLGMADRRLLLSGVNGSSVVGTFKNLMRRGRNVNAISQWPVLSRSSTIGSAGERPVD